MEDSTATGARGNAGDAAYSANCGPEGGGGRIGLDVNDKAEGREGLFVRANLEFIISG